MFYNQGDNFKLTLILHIKNIIVNDDQKKIFSDDFLKDLLSNLIDLLLGQNYTDLFINNTCFLINLIINHFSKDSKILIK